MVDVSISSMPRLPDRQVPTIGSTLLFQAKVAAFRALRLVHDAARPLLAMTRRLAACRAGKGEHAGEFDDFQRGGADRCRVHAPQADDERLCREPDLEALPSVATPNGAIAALKLIAESHTAREIAEILVISEKTVERHRSNILEKLGGRDRVALTRYAIKRGLVEP